MNGYQPNNYAPQYGANNTNNTLLNNQQRYAQLVYENPHLAMGQYQQPPQTPQLPPLKGRPVTGMEEARAAQIDLDGSVHIFTDIPNGKIYTKQLGMNGACIFTTYMIQATPIESEQHNIVQSRTSETDISASPLLVAFESRLAELEKKINQYEGVFLNGGQLNAVATNTAKQRKSNGNVTADGTE